MQLDYVSVMSFSPLFFSSTYSLLYDLFVREPVAARLFVSATLASSIISIIGSYIYSQILVNADPNLQTFLLVLFYGHKMFDILCEMPIFILSRKAIM
jgi:hypothetical protein